MPTLRIPTPLRSYTNGQNQVAVQGETVRQALDDLTGRYPSLRPHLFNDAGGLRPFVNLFLDEDNIRDLQELNTPLKPGDVLRLIPSIAGGSGRQKRKHASIAFPL